MAAARSGFVYSSDANETLGSIISVVIRIHIPVYSMFHLDLSRFQGFVHSVAPAKVLLSSVFT